ncbi:MAG: hypothetical protein F9K24_07695 [Leptonema illini]|jgi:hypothetical protein|uniref:Activator of Hsp90 ATPase 1 family protein n=1 Tax=Leptonema illini TaxID=183 RepID=A0A833LXR5_9LEPT|nr:MAG: hypothetical protein F9K24_07695 [Leptonema illini]PKL33370.1 MAG: hypothetical protein CVV45_07945 [Spirochaetae bacterium HGW-Spirochaetae-10]
MYENLVPLADRFLFDGDMNRREELDPLEFSLQAVTTPARAFRTLTSQTELRKWWAPRVIMSRNIVSHKPGDEVEMILLTQDKNELIRYGLKGRSWPSQQGETIITFEIEDRGVRRGSAGEGIRVNIYHEGWTDPALRAEYEAIWKLAAPALEMLLRDEEPEPWWDNDTWKGEYRPAVLADLKEFLRRMEEETRAKKEKQKASKILWKVFQELDGKGEWYCKENYTEMEFVARGQKIFGAQKAGQLVMSWRELDPILGRNLQDFADRFSIEQDMDIRVGQNYDRMPASRLNPDLFIRWCNDVISHRGDGT